MAILIVVSIVQQHILMAKNNKFMARLVVKKMGHGKRCSIYFFPSFSSFRTLAQREGGMPAGLGVVEKGDGLEDVEVVCMLEVCVLVVLSESWFFSSNTVCPS